MDETIIADIKERNQGAVVYAQRKRQVDDATHAKTRVCPRCSLVESITTDNDPQRHLPHIFLPRGRNDEPPPQTVREVFSRASARVEGCAALVGSYRLMGPRASCRASLVVSADVGREIELI